MQTDRHTHREIHKQTTRQTNCNENTKRIQRTQTPPRLWPLTLWCDLDLSSRSRKLMSLDVAYSIVSLVPDMMSMGLILYEISPFLYFMWPVTFTCEFQLCQGLIIRCILCCLMFLPKTWFGRENGYYVTVTFTFDPRSPYSIGSEPVREASI